MEGMESAKSAESTANMENTENMDSAGGVVRKVRIVLVEDDDIFASNFRDIVSHDERLVYLGCAESAKAGIAMAIEKKPDIVVMDLNLSGFPAMALDGVDAAREIRLKTGIKIIILTALEDEDTTLSACKKSFASGYIFKSHFLDISA